MSNLAHFSKRDLVIESPVCSFLWTPNCKQVPSMSTSFKLPKVSPGLMVLVIRSAFILFRAGSGKVQSRTCQPMFRSRKTRIQLTKWWMRTDSKRFLSLVATPLHIHLAWLSCFTVLSAVVLKSKLVLLNKCSPSWVSTPKTQGQNSTKQAQDERSFVGRMNPKTSRMRIFVIFERLQLEVLLVKTSFPNFISLHSS